MGITAIGTGFGSFEALTNTDNPNSGDEILPGGVASQSDVVEISQKAKELARRANGSSETDLPLEAYSLPKWYADLSSDLLLVDTELGVSYPESNRARYDALSRREKRDLAEYQGKLDAYFQESLKEFGIETTLDYYHQIVLDPAKSEEVHQAVKQKLSGDEQAMRLMERFGIAL